jgi:NAD(P)-dependent dehydrogenase (short-subunit alcohol dehydrogenase family)
MSDKKLTGKVAVITGASRGLGKSMALALAGAGAKLALVARDQGKLNEVAEAIRKEGGEAETFLADVTDEAAVPTLAASVKERFGAVHILINNAGINVRGNLVDYKLEDWQKVLATNLTAVFLLCRAFVPHLKGQGFGRIINMTSILSHVGLAGRTAYCSSKAGLLGFTKALALELVADQITVNGISPGPFATEMNLPVINNPEANAKFLANIPLGQWGDVKDMGALAVFLASDDSKFITGTDIVIDGGWLSQ